MEVLNRKSDGQQDAIDTAAARVVLVGNPNVGKSLLFRNLTNRFVMVSNYPGTTVEVVRARANFNGRSRDVIDTPGINDLVPRSDDARVTLGVMDDNPGATIVQVADARNLRRALYLTLQLFELDRPMVLVLNMQDELLEQGGKIDTETLSRILGIPVVRTVATRNEGTSDVVDAISLARRPRLDPQYREQAESNGRYGGGLSRLASARQIVEQTYSIDQPSRASLRIRLGFWAMHPVKGLFFLAGILGIVFWFVGLLGAGTLVDLLEVGLFEQNVSPLAIRMVDGLLPFPHEHEMREVTLDVGIPLTPVHELPVGTSSRMTLTPGYAIDAGAELSLTQQISRLMHDLLVGEFGLITMALSYAFAIILPIVTTFFLVFSLLEDSGYFPRMAIMVNKTFRIMGLNGKAVLPMILGLGCATMATMTTRILDSKKERLVTTILLALAIPCSAQLGVLLAMMAVLSPVGAVIWTLLIVAVLLAVGWLSSHVFEGETNEFILEIPPMRRPKAANVLMKTATRLEWYLREVIPIFVIGTAVLFVLDKLDALSAIALAGKPVVSGWLGLPPEMANAFLVGFLRRDFGAVYLLDAVTGPDPLLTPLQILVGMVTITLFMPCFANFLMIAKEYGLKTAWKMAGFIFPFAFLLGGLINWVGQWILAS